MNIKILFLQLQKLVYEFYVILFLYFAMKHHEPVLVGQYFNNNKSKQQTYKTFLSQSQIRD